MYLNNLDVFDILLEWGEHPHLEELTQNYYKASYVNFIKQIN